MGRCTIKSLKEKRILGQPTENPVIVEALNLTMRTIERRARRYRNLVIIVTVVALSSAFCAIVSRSWLFLGGFILLVPLVGGFLLLDHRNVMRWRAEILQMVRSRGLDRAVFVQSVFELRRFSPSSLQAMLSMIPKEATEKGEVVEFDNGQRAYERRIVFALILLILALCCLFGSAYSQSIALLCCGFGFLLLLTILGRRSKK
jgi:hypothetical protein